MECPQQHPLQFAAHGHVFEHSCNVCGEEIPRVAPRHTCWRCAYYVCYDCAMHLHHTTRSGHLALSSPASAVQSRPRTPRRRMQCHIQRKQSRRQSSVAICRSHDIASPHTGAVRTQQHNRTRHGISEDCRFVAYSSAEMPPSLRVARGGRRPSAAAEEGGRAETGRELAALVLQRAADLLQLVGGEVEAGTDGFDAAWQPALQGVGAAAGGGQDLLSWLVGGGDVRAKLERLCLATQEVLQGQRGVSEVSVPAKIFGDIHGQLRDLLLLFHFYGLPGEDDGAMSYVFNGDWVDRGAHQLEVVVLLLALKVLHPERVWLNRGNHEDEAQNRKITQDGGLGFDLACVLALGPTDGELAFRAFHAVFDWLPLAARVGGRVLVLHGGLGNGEWSVEALAAVARPLESSRIAGELGGAVYNVLWSDPLLADRFRPAETFGAQQSGRSRDQKVQDFGRDVTERFCKREGLGMIVRSHQFKRSGRCFELMHEGWLMRVFSARNYCGKHLNDGGLLLVDWAPGSPGTLLVKPQAVERHTRLDGPRTETFLEPYCPKSHLMQALRPPQAAQHSSCLHFLHLPSRRVRPERWCDECGVPADGEGLPFFHCPGCGDYGLCFQCARALALHSTLPADSSDSDGDAPAPSRRAGQQAAPQGGGARNAPAGAFPPRWEMYLGKKLECSDRFITLA